MKFKPPIQASAQKIILFIGIYLGIYVPIFAQFTVRFDVYDPSQKPEIFLAGSFNNWSPGNPNYKLKDVDRTHKYIVIKINSPGKYSFKFTRGNWSTAESGPAGISENRQIDVHSDTTIQSTVAGWSDAKATVRFDVYDPSQKPEIFLAGSFNFWNPGNPDYKLKDVDQSHKSIVVRISSPGKYLFKFTRGNWGTVESDPAGFNIDNREIEIYSDTTLQLTIAGWMDGYFDLSKFPDSIRISANRNRSFFFEERNLDSSYEYAVEAFKLSQKIDNKSEISASLIKLAQVVEKKGNPDKALELLFQALPITESLNDTFELAGLNYSIGNIFKSQNDYPKAQFYFHNVIIRTSQNDARGFFRPRSFLRLGEIYFISKQFDSAAYYARKSNEVFGSAGAFLLLGDVEKIIGNKELAMANYRQAVSVESLTTLSSSDMAQSYQRIAQELAESSQADSAFSYARMSLAIANQVKNPFTIASSSSLLSRLFANEKRFDSAYLYQQIALITNDSLFTTEKQKQIHNLVFNDQLHKQELAAEKAKLRSRAWIYSLLGGLVILLLTALLLIRNNNQKKKANILLARQKEQIETTLTELRATQQQLIQSEKMASLGELTAGIAHEIQNPLNFVTNFSELSSEMLDEMKGQLATGNSQLAIELADDLKQNLDKINHHGKRADAIVKGMLQHTRTGSGQKEPTNINALCAEYLRITYHGLKAKDKSYNVKIETDLDPAIGKIDIIPQDIGRVIINLINNALYAVHEKAKAQFDQGGKGYDPRVTVRTRKMNNRIEIGVEDNGNGIPQEILGKIFQPFFTTKPTGQGTGLGLSLAYDIVKAHGGEIKIETREGEGTKFIIELPVSKNA